MKKIAIFTLIAQINQQKYIKRLINWFNQFQNNSYLMQNSDFFISVDGKVDQILIKKYLSNFKFNILNNQPKAGIKFGTMYWPGWKISFINMLKYLTEYQSILFVESDVKIINFQKIIFLLNQKNYTFASIINNNPCFSMQTSLMILNNKQDRNNLIQFYQKNENLFNQNGLDIQGQCTMILKPNIALSSYRISKNQINNNFNYKIYDFIGNYWHND